ncbi:MAG: insulinase family protein [Chitinophagia bacterium]|nr:insulinase family protein [Chitinophagia bacterium]
MKLRFLSLLALGVATLSNTSQAAEKIKFTEYDLPNGLHVILHEDHATPIVAVSVMYHVGSKNEKVGRTGFAHFFEHLLFEGSENIKRGEYMKLVQAAGGQLNANTSQDRTFYFESLPSNQLELGLWMESERMLHAKIDTIGVETQRKVVKEEKKQSYDNRPYGQLLKVVYENSFTEHPYHWTPIGYDKDLSEATIDEFINFYKTYYVPNNATLVIGGDIDPIKTKALIAKYFGSIPKGTKELYRPSIVEPAQTAEKRTTFYDNIQLPALILSYRAPKPFTKDAYAMQLLAQLLSQGNSSRLRNALVDKQQKAVEVGAFPMPSEDPGVVMMFAIANMGVKNAELEAAMNDEIEKVRTTLISDEEYKKLMNQIESDFINQNRRILGIIENLATNYTYLKNTNLVNTELALYQQVTKEDIMRVAKEYLTKENRLVVDYLPKSEEKK